MKKKRSKLMEMFAPQLGEAGPSRGSDSVMDPTGQKLFSIELADKTFVVRAKNRGEAIVYLSGIVGKDTITRGRDQLQQHLGPVVQVNRGTGDVEELDTDDLSPAGGPPPLPKREATDPDDVDDDWKPGQRTVCRRCKKHQATPPGDLCGYCEDGVEKRRD